MVPYTKISISGPKTAIFKKINFFVQFGLPEKVYKIGGIGILGQFFGKKMIIADYGPDLDQETKLLQLEELMVRLVENLFKIRQAKRQLFCKK